MEKKKKRKKTAVVLFMTYQNCLLHFWISGEAKVVQLINMMQCSKEELPCSEQTSVGMSSFLDQSYVYSATEASTSSTIKTSICWSILFIQLKIAPY
jgi:hypothetical protein